MTRHPAFGISSLLPPHQINNNYLRKLVWNQHHSPTVLPSPLVNPHLVVRVPLAHVHNSVPAERDCAARALCTLALHIRAAENSVSNTLQRALELSLIHISEPTRQ